MKIIGQLKLLEKINNYNLNNLPHSLLIIGDKGSGKHLISNYIATKFNLPLINITEDINEEFISNLYNNILPSFYLIDLSLITEKEQNKLLKLIEEPQPNCYLILISEHKNLILNTIYNRCFLLNILPYTKEELQSFTSFNIDENIFKTPGQIINFNFNTLNNTNLLVDTIIDKFDKTTLSNILNISDKFNYKDEYDKLDLNVFINMLLYKLNKKYLETNNNLYLNYYLKTKELKTKLLDKRLNYQLAVENYLIKMWRVAQNEH